MPLIRFETKKDEGAYLLVTSGGVSMGGEHDVVKAALSGSDTADMSFGKVAMQPGMPQGFGVVGRWLADALDTQAERLAARFGCAVQIVGIANARDGFAYDAGGLDLRSVLAASRTPRSA